METVTQLPGKARADGGDPAPSIELPTGDYHRVVVNGDDGDPDYLKCADRLAAAVLMRDKYKGIDRGQEEDYSDFGDMGETLVMEDGIFNVIGLRTTPTPWSQYVKDIKALFDLLEVGAWLSVSRTRLTVLEEKFELYTLLNGEVESSFNEETGGGGIHAPSVRVDNSVKLSTGMNAQVLMRYIHKTVQEHGSENIKLTEDGQPIQLREVLTALGVEDATQLTAEGLGLHPPQRKRFNELDILDPHLTKSETADVLQLFLQPFKTTNNGKFYAGLVRPMLEDHEKAMSNKRGHPRVATEYKFPIRGEKDDEWERIAVWIKNNLKVGYSCNRWVAQIQRRFPATGGDDDDEDDVQCNTVEDQLRNIFGPLFRATMHPLDFPALAEVLKNVGAINITSDEAFRRRNLHAEVRPPASFAWSDDRPDDYYFFYYVWANLCTLNALRKRKGLNTIQFRPTCGESTPHWDQCIISYLLADSVTQGIKLGESWVLQYLYMMGRIGICMSPLSNNAACFSIFENPFLLFFKRGLLVSLATDDPLHYHHAAEPLLEEYATAQRVYQLSATDLSEIARNSVLISSFPEEHKKEWIGSTGWDGGFSHKSMLCDFRLRFRHDCLLHEQALMNYVLEQQHNGKKDPKGAQISIARFATTTARPRDNTGPRVERRKNYLDHRVQYPRISVGNRISEPLAYRRSVETIGDVLARRKKYVDPVLCQAAKCRKVRVDDVFRADGEPNRDPDTSDYDEDDLVDPTEALILRGAASPPLSPSKGLNSTTNTAAAAAASSPKSTQPVRERAATAAATTLLRPGETWNADNWTHAMYFGVNLVGRIGTAPVWPDFVPEIKEFVEDVRFVTDIAQNDVLLDVLARLRLDLLEHRYKLHLNMNIGRETGNLKDKELNNRDFYTARKVDNNVHMEASMNARLLHHFFTDKVRNAGHDVVMERNGVPVTLRQVIREQGINVERLTVDELTTRLSDKRAGGSQELKDIFLRPDNYMGGRYFAELTKLVLENNKLDDFCFSELRLEIRGEDPEEWVRLAEWFDRYGMASAQNSWVIKFPRIFERLRANNTVRDFGEYLENLFSVLWNASMRPAQYTKLHYMLSNIAGFDFVGDETEVDGELTANTAPHEWRKAYNPPYSYYLYYLWANIVTLNDFRRKRGLSMFMFRPHCGEAGGVEHLAAGLLLASNINHGVTLSRFPSMEYLFFIAQVGITMSPLSNTDGVIPYLENPFPKFFSRGLLVSLSTNVPLRFHFTSEPLIEEYSIAAKIWVLSANDLSELSRNSVIMSGFPRTWKKDALGPLFKLRSTLGNDVRRSRVSDIRVAFRYEVYHTELDFLDSILNAIDPEEVADSIEGATSIEPKALPRAMLLLSDEVRRYELQTGNVVPDPSAAGVGGAEPAGLGTGAGSALDKLKMQIDHLQRAIADRSKDMHDALGQNKMLADEIVKVNHRAEAAERDATVLRAAFVSEEDQWGWEEDDDTMAGMAGLQGLAGTAGEPSQ